MKFINVTKILLKVYQKCYNWVQLKKQEEGKKITPKSPRKTGEISKQIPTSKSRERERIYLKKSCSRTYQKSREQRSYADMHRLLAHRKS